jgi:Xaa-Pro aminopeptidase
MNKIDQALALMEQEGIDLLVASSEVNIALLTGYWSVGKRVLPQIPMFATLDRKGKVHMVSGKADLPSALQAGMKPEQFRFYGNFFFAFADPDEYHDLRQAVAAPHETGYEALATLNNGAKKVALDGEGLTHAAWLKTEAAFPGAEAVDWSQQFKTLRLHKEAGELALLERSGQIMEEAVNLACRQYRPGQTENDVRIVIEKYVVEQGGRPSFTVVASGPNGAFVDTATTDRVIGPNDSVRFDVGCIYQGYHSDIARTAYTGEPSRKLQQYYQAIYRGLRAMVDIARPGTPAADLYQAGVRVTQENGIPHYQRNHCGHGIGREVYELPPITPFSTYKLEPGMTMCLETPYYEIGWTGIQVEDTLVITGNGCRLFTHSPPEMIRLGA